MKKSLILFSLLLTTTIASNAQIFQSGSQAFNAGIGFGVPGYYDGSMRLPSFLASYDHGILHKLGIGYLGVGGQTGFQFTKDKYAHHVTGNYYEEYSHTYFLLGARATYHFAFYDMTKEPIFRDLDVYAGIVAGFKVDFTDGPVSHSGALHNVFAGARYLFSDGFGVYAELGYDVAYLNLGVTFDF
ncbi:MAG: hypothetical protein MI922_12205 [Bacteroidales bacterium]|nr:hypothetical protein [Bacteroidales bacterium]